MTSTAPNSSRMSATSPNPLGNNPNATGKSRPLWNNLRTKMELHRMKLAVK